MDLFLSFAAICLLVNQGCGMHSYQSILNSEGRPILRSDSGRDQSQAGEASMEDEGWLVRLRSRIERLVARYGYDAAKPHIQEAVNAVEKQRGVLLDVHVSRDGGSRTSFEYKNALRSLGKLSAREGPAEEPEEEWVTNLKSYVKRLISQYGKRTLDFHLGPVIKSLEEKHKVRITDIDVDTYGDVTVKYDKKSEKTMMPKAGYRHRRVTQIIESI